MEKFVQVSWYPYDISHGKMMMMMKFMSHIATFCHWYHTSFRWSSQPACQTLPRWIQNKGSPIMTLCLDIFMMCMFAKPNLANCLLNICNNFIHTGACRQSKKRTTSTPWISRWIIYVSYHIFSFNGLINGVQNLIDICSSFET